MNNNLASPFFDMERDVIGGEDALRPEWLGEALASSLFSQNILYLESVDSTNRVAKELSAAGAAEGTLVLAEEQTFGRGRRGRSWLSPKGVSILSSLIVRPPIDVDQAFVLTMILALAVSDGVRDIAGIRPLIKWPNDLYVGRRKLCGILTEFSVREGTVDYMILGFGLNVNWYPDDERELINPATSILRETGRPVNREDLLVRILSHLDESYRTFLLGEVTGFYRRWNELSMILGRDVVIAAGKETLRGVAVSIDRQGALILRDASGVDRVVLNGDVSLSL